MVKVGIINVTGYAGMELARILRRHPDAEITSVTGRSLSGQKLGDAFPHLSDIDLTITDDVTESVDVVFSALPHAASAERLGQALAGGVKAIDISADFRLRDIAEYESWYNITHPCPEYMEESVYGLTELHREDVKTTSLVANPGCYTSTSILALAPLLSGRLIEPTGICIDAKSGVSGAGRSPKLATLFPECNESISAYGVGNHRHTPEITGVLSRAGGQEVQVVFTPHLVPMERGILCTIYCRPTGDDSQEAVLESMRTYYEGCPFVRIVDHLPRTRDVAGTNFCDITVRSSGGHLVVFSALDNLVKGAAGVAVQNFNLMYGFSETTGLLPA